MSVRGFYRIVLREYSLGSQTHEAQLSDRHGVYFVERTLPIMYLITKRTHYLHVVRGRPEECDESYEYIYNQIVHSPHEGRG